MSHKSLAIQKMVYLDVIVLLGNFCGCSIWKISCFEQDFVEILREQELCHFDVVCITGQVQSGSHLIIYFNHQQWVLLEAISDSTDPSFVHGSEVDINSLIL